MSFRLTNGILNASMGRRIVDNHSLLLYFSGKKKNEIKKEALEYTGEEARKIFNCLLEETAFILSKGPEKGSVVYCGFGIESKYFSGFSKEAKVPEELYEYCFPLPNDGKKRYFTNVNELSPDLYIGSIESFVEDLRNTWAIRLYAFIILSEVTKFSNIKSISENQKGMLHQCVMGFASIASTYIDDRKYKNHILNDSRSKLVEDFLDPYEVELKLPKGRPVEDRKKFILDSLWQEVQDSNGILKRVFVRIHGPNPIDYFNIENNCVLVMSKGQLADPIINYFMSFYYLDYFFLNLKTFKSITRYNYFYKRRKLREDPEFHFILEGKDSQDLVNENHIWANQWYEEYRGCFGYLNYLIGASGDKYFMKTFPDKDHMTPDFDSAYKDSIIEDEAAGVKLKRLKVFELIEKMIYHQEIKLDIPTFYNEYFDRAKATSELKKVLKNGEINHPFDENENVNFKNKVTIGYKYRIGIVYEHPNLIPEKNLGYIFF